MPIKIPDFDIELVKIQILVSGASLIGRASALFYFLEMENIYILFKKAFPRDLLYKIGLFLAVNLLNCPKYTKLYLNS